MILTAGDPEPTGASPRSLPGMLASIGATKAVFCSLYYRDRNVCRKVAGCLKGLGVGFYSSDDERIIRSFRIYFLGAGFCRHDDGPLESD